MKPTTAISPVKQGDRITIEPINSVIEAVNWLVDQALNGREIAICLHCGRARAWVAGDDCASCGSVKFRLVRFVVETILHDEKMY
jgi:hypothetical protein